MEIYIKIISKLQQLASLGKINQDIWSSLSIEGDYGQQIIPLFIDVFSLCKKANVVHSLAFELESISIDGEELQHYSSSNIFQSWRVKITKEIWVKSETGGYFVNFFMASNNCVQWLDGQDILEASHPINKTSPLKIIIVDLPKSFGGEWLQFISVSDKQAEPYKNNIQLPQFDVIKKNVRISPSLNIAFNPNSFVLEQGDFNSELAQVVIKKAIKVLAACLSSEIHSLNKVYLDGFKKIEIALVNGSDTFSRQQYTRLVQAVKWIYENSIGTRKKLFCERISLEVNLEFSLMYNLALLLELSLTQAQERFEFVILERKDAYLKELKDLLKDLRTQSDLYSAKIRTLLSNFLRDALAGIALIGFTVFTKFTDNISLNKSNLLKYVFYGLAIYYLGSIILQMFVDIADIVVTIQELKYWKKAAKELIPEKEFKKHYQESLSLRTYSLYILYPVIMLLYIGIAFACYKYPVVFENLLLQ